ncbi:MAG: HEAT repeat domain-containing protein, partial [Thermomicrobiales bacterium]
MSTSTSHQPDDAGLGAVDRVLVQDIDAAEGGLLVQPLSDLSRAAAAYLKERWPGLPSATRLAFVQAMRQDAEEQIEHNYNRALLVALRDADAETRLSAIDGLAELDSHVFCVMLLEHVEDEPDERVRAVEAMALGRFALQSELDLLDD